MGKSVLIVSGNQELPNTLAAVVGKDWAVSVFPNSGDALRGIRERDKGAPLDLMLIENDLADLEGLSFLRILRERLGSVPPTVLCVGKPLDEASQARAEKFSLLDILVRPVRPADLERAIAPLLWVSAGSFMSVVEFLGMALREGLSGSYQIESSTMTFKAEVRQGHLLFLRSALFRDRWRAGLAALGWTLPPQSHDPDTDLDHIEASTRFDPDLLQAKTQAALSLLAAIPSTEPISVRKLDDATGATELPVPIFGLLTALIGHCSDEQLAPLRAENLKLVSKATSALRNLPLTPQQGYIISLCGAPMAIQDIVRTGVLPEPLLIRSVFLLILLGALRTEPECPEPFTLGALASRCADEARRIHAQKEGIRNLAASLRHAGRSPYDILGVVPGTSYGIILGTYEVLKRQLGPLTLHGQVLKEMESDLTWINAKFSEAFLLIQAQWLQDGHQKLEAEAKSADGKNIRRLGLDLTEQQQISQNRLEEAERLYHHAASLMDNENYHQAFQYIKLALFYNPMSAPYQYLMGRMLSLMSAPRAKHASEKAYLRAIELDPFAVEYRIALAHLYLSLDLLTRCRAQLEKIQALDPKSTELAYVKKALKEREKKA